MHPILAAEYYGHSGHLPDRRKHIVRNKNRYFRRYHAQKAVGDGCVETTVDGRQGSYCLNIVTHRFATAAHDTFIHVTDDGRRTVYLKGGLFSLIPYFTDTQVVGYCLQFAISVAATGKATGRMVGQNQFHHCLPGIHYPGSMGPYNHSFRTFHLTGRGQVTAAFNFHYTDTAGAGIVLVMQIFEFI